MRIYHDNRVINDIQYNLILDDLMSILLILINIFADYGRDTRFFSFKGYRDYFILRSEYTLKLVVK